MRFASKLLLGSVLLFTALSGIALPANATVLYSTGFEQPTFTPGIIAGQDGWLSFGESAASQVENAFAYAGAQAADVIPALATTQAGPFKTIATSATIVQQSAEIWLSSSSDQSAWQFAATGANLSGFVGGIDIRTNGNIDLISSTFPTIGTFARDQWNKVDLTFNFATQTYSVALNGSTIASNAAFCGNNFGTCSGAVVSAYSDGFFDSFGGVPNVNDIGFIDNYSVTSIGTVPLPASAPMFGAAVLAVAAAGYAAKHNKAAATA